MHAFKVFFIYISVLNVFVNFREMNAIPVYYSQFGQDRFINEQLFHNKQNGVFVDIGAHNGIRLSNTYFFEKELGWTGICFEPNPTVFPALKNNRTAICLQLGVSDYNGDAQFWKIEGIQPEYGSMWSGLVDTYEQKHKDYLNTLAASNENKWEKISIGVCKLNDILNEYNIKHIDFLSIDTEGSEEIIVRAIDFEAFDIDVLAVENNYENKEIRNYLISQGYEFVTRIVIDDIFRKRQSVYRND